MKPTVVPIKMTVIASILIVSFFFSVVDLYQIIRLQNFVHFNGSWRYEQGGSMPPPSTSISSSSNQYTSDPNPDAPWPRLAWLMSYPNSGTSFTMKLVSRLSNLTVASNYGTECDIDEITGTNKPLYSESPAGPFLLHLSVRESPTTYIMAKTHCGSRCNKCGPSKYVESEQSFLEMCAKGSRMVTEVDTISGTQLLTKLDVKYDPNLAQRAIHLVRNPFNNIVSNFHLERNENAKKDRKEWLQKYSNDASGFKAYCSDLDQRHAVEESLSQMIPGAIKVLFQEVPCHSHFYIFAQVRYDMAVTPSVCALRMK